MNDRYFPPDHLLLITLAILIGQAIVLAQPQQPGISTSQPQEEAVWSSRPSSTAQKDEDGNTTTWSNENKFLAGHVERTFFGPTNCPVALVIDEVWDLKQLRSTGVKLKAMPNHFRTQVVISADGQFAAATDTIDLPAQVPNTRPASPPSTTTSPNRNRSSGLKRTYPVPTPDRSPLPLNKTVVVWNLQTGDKVLQTDPAEREAKSMMFAGGKHLVLSGINDRKLDVWNLSTGRRSHQIPLRESPSIVATTPNGRYVAVVVREHLCVYEVSSGQQVAVMHTPSQPATNQLPQLTSSNPVTPPAPNSSANSSRPTKSTVNSALAERQKSINASAFYQGIRYLAFSPDGKELASLSTTGQMHRLVVWDNQGKIVVNEYLGRQSNLSANKLQWFPDGSGWLIDNFIYDRNTRKVILVISDSRLHRISAYLLDKNRFLAPSSEARDTMDVFTVPWPRIEKSLKAFMADAPAYLRPQQPVSIRFEAGALRGDAGEAQKMLLDALAKKLEKLSIPVQEKAPTYFRVRLEEKAGRTLPIHERNWPFDIMGRDTGRKATATEAELVVELYAAELPHPMMIWRFSSSSSLSYSVPITDAVMRTSALERLTYDLQNLDVPYFMPTATDLDPLPMRF